MKLSRRQRIVRKPDPQALSAARRDVARWAAWLVAPVAIFPAAALLGLDRSFVAVGLLGLPVVLIRAIIAWGEYQQMRQDA